MHKIVPYITACNTCMQMSGILRYMISRKRPTVNTQQEDEDDFHLDTPRKSSSETVRDIQPTTSPRIHCLPLFQKRKGLIMRD